MSDVVLVLASASPARLATLRGAGIEPVVEVSNVDESAEHEPAPARLAATLARLKAREVASRTAADPRGRRLFVLGCDSVLEVEGVAYGKPITAAVATERLRRLSGRTATLHTGHHLIELGSETETLEVASTQVTFGELTAGEIAAYVATGEPLRVAGAFTIDGLGGAFVERVEGDPHNVVGLSLPLLRRMLAARGVAWHELWHGKEADGSEAAAT